MQYDFLVVGAGVSGAAVAHELVRHGSVLLLEAEATPGYHATGRSAALFTPHQGTPLVQAINRASAEFFATPPSGFSAQPLLSPRGGLTIAEPGQEHCLSALLALSAPGRDVNEISVEAALALVPLLRPERVGAAVHEPGVADIDVAALHQGFLRSVKRHGGTLACGQRICGLSHNEGLWTARTSDSSFQARIIINAAGAWADHVAALAGARPIGLVPKRRTAIIVDAPPDFDPRPMPAVDFTASDAYFKPDGGRIMASLGDQEAVDAQDIQADEWEIAVLADWLQRETRVTIQKINHSWAGLRSFVVDENPVIGFDDELPNFFWLAGQGGYGIMMAPALGQAAAALALHHDMPIELTSQGLVTADLQKIRPALERHGEVLR
ncbi:NAD(P)/FAD-dependent oxidoreductase [Roseinatronobacter alkalisoli]|uniref:FAD-binding oxidoreductase n=1 Tax=Roseinatronobacter alkalisoli TaxID=3028235 RepID=A0ABT5TDP6_9RHOB|nr:FAD-binding oxidoreductase [Roseinatronobacter sp. HJB301]MDD7973238.1 FAD-binding oxidoreductase [Roseinatronobacter sp. HJB301]